MLFLKAMLILENTWFTVNNQQNPYSFNRVKILPWLSEAFLVRSHFSSYTQVLNTVILCFSQVNAYCNKTSYPQYKKIPTLRSTTLLLGLLWSSNRLLILLQLVAFSGGQEGGGKHALQNSGNLHYFLWAILLEEYFEKSRLLKSFQVSQSTEVKSW